MTKTYKTLTVDRIAEEHICCAISDKKHQEGVKRKKQWMKEQMQEGLIFRKLDVNGKVFIEYIPAQNAWVPIEAPDYMYINCLWVSGSYKGDGTGKELLQSCIDDAKEKGFKGLVTITSKKKRPFLSDKKFLLKQGFEVVDSAAPDFELVALHFDEKQAVTFRSQVHDSRMKEEEGFTFYYVPQCPYIPNCIKEIQKVADEEGVIVHFHEITSKEEAQAFIVPWTTFAVFKDGEFISNTLLNGNSFKKLLVK